METKEFALLLEQVSSECRAFAETYVQNTLPPSYLYYVRLNQSFDEPPLDPREIVFPDDSIIYSERVGPSNKNDVVQLLCRNHMIPEWVDISVCEADSEHTYLELLCCGRFSSDNSLFYYHSSGNAPFGIKSPAFPPRWSEADGRFDLNWKRGHTQK